ncbi:MAG: triose-phosphate isomerase [Candidatus Paceibacterota bacterium]
MSENPSTSPVVAANWKMHPDNLHAAQKLFTGIKRTASYLKHVTTVICPPSLFLGALSESYGGTKIILGSQDVSRFSGVGSQTGEVSAEMIADSGAGVSIIGHSERRAMGENTANIKAKAMNALNANLGVIYCIGESERDEDGQYLAFLQSQILDVFKNIPGRFHDKITIAYEPLWAIGGGADKAVTPHDLHQASLFIRKVLQSHFSMALAHKTKILYGGSVKRDNARELFTGTNIDGFLIGGASLDADHFCDILRIINDISEEIEKNNED